MQTVLNTKFLACVNRIWQKNTDDFLEKVKKSVIDKINAQYARYGISIKNLRMASVVSDKYGLKFDVEFDLKVPDSMQAFRYVISVGIGSSVGMTLKSMEIVGVEAALVIGVVSALVMGVLAYLGIRAEEKQKFKSHIESQINSTILALGAELFTLWNQESLKVKGAILENLEAVRETILAAFQEKLNELDSIPEKSTEELQKLLDANEALIQQLDALQSDIQHLQESLLENHA